jgi:hypothetical protein
MSMFGGYSPASTAWLEPRIGHPRVVFSLLKTTSARSGAMRFCWASAQTAAQRRCGWRTAEREAIEADLGRVRYLAALLGSTAAARK